MIIKQTTVTRLEITEAPKLDPIRVYVEDYESGKGRIVINCYDAAWAGYWGGMSGRTISKFFTDCDAEYLAGNLGCAAALRNDARSRAYLVRIIEAVQAAFREVAHVE